MAAPGAGARLPFPHPHVEKGQADARGPTTAALPVPYLALYIDSISSIDWPFGPVWTRSYPHDFPAGCEPFGRSRLGTCHGPGGARAVLRRGGQAVLCAG